MSNERFLFEVDRVLIDSVQVLGLVGLTDCGTIEALLNKVSALGNERLGLPPDPSVHDIAASEADPIQYLKSTIRPCMYNIVTRCHEADAMFVFRCFNAVAILAEHSSDMTEDRLTLARVARDIVAEFVDPPPVVCTKE